ncbi:MAG: hypothetical protein M1818_002249 [Claussenomyces sp. TS43310]|nr:MAG: hypothetical protein M1818_002249 [Claussenomyces sp. TS43310]
MPRSATDATRFTSTTPHASVRPPPSAGKMPLRQRNPGPAGETPQQKVARLRAAAAKAHDADISTLDRFAIRGRVWADRAHRFTALSLIGITGICGVVTVYALGDMMIHNRRKRNEYFAQQKALREAALHEANEAQRRGSPTEAQQILLMEEVQLMQQAEAKKAAKAQGVLARSKQWLLSGLKKEEEGDDYGSSERRLGYEGMNEEDDVLGERESDILRAIEEKKAEMQEKARSILEREKDLQRTGGPLDRIGTTSDAKKSENNGGGAGGWLSFMSRK